MADLQHRARGRPWNIAVTFAVVTRVHSAVVAFRMRAHVREMAAGTATSVDGNLSITMQKEDVNARLSITAPMARGLEAHVSAKAHLEVGPSMRLAPRSRPMISARKAKRARNSGGASKQAKRPSIASRDRTRSGGRVVSFHLKCCI